MNRASSFENAPLQAADGQQIGEVSDVVFDPHTHRVLCFTIAPGGGWFGGIRILAWSDDLSLASQTPVVLSENQIVPARKVDRIREILESSPVTVGTSIAAPDGQRLGIISEIFFASDTGKVHQYEIKSAMVLPGERTRRHIKVSPQQVNFEGREDGALVVTFKTAEFLAQHFQIE